MHTNNEAPLCNVTTAIIVKIKNKYHLNIIHQFKKSPIKIIYCYSIGRTIITKTLNLGSCEYEPSSENAKVIFHIIWHFLKSQHYQLLIYQ